MRNQKFSDTKQRLLAFSPLKEFRLPASLVPPASGFILGLPISDRPDPGCPVPNGLIPPLLLHVGASRAQRAGHAFNFLTRLPFSSSKCFNYYPHFLLCFLSTLLGRRPQFWPLLIGAGVAVTVVGGRAAYTAFSRFAANRAAVGGAAAAMSMSKNFYTGGFESAMTRREAALILGCRCAWGATALTRLECFPPLFTLE